MKLTDCIKKEWNCLIPLKSTLKFSSVSSTTTDNQGNICITGRLQGDLKEVTVKDSPDSYLGKYTGNGQELWLKPVSTSYWVIVHGMAADGKGNLYITGYARGKPGQGAPGDDKDIYIARFSGSNGKEVWFDVPGTKASDEGRAIATDSQGNIFITGYTRGDLKEGAYKGAEDIFIARFSGNGRQEWLEQLGTWVSDIGLAITADSQGNVYITGYTQDHLKEHAHKGAEDIFIARFSGNGRQEWLEQLGTKASDLGLGIAADRFNNVYVTGYTVGDFQEDTKDKKGPRSVFLARYDSETGVKQGSEEQLGFHGQAEAKGITTDSAGNVYISGYIRGMGMSRYNAKKKSTHIFHARFSGNGEKQCVALDISWCDEVNGITMDSKGNVYFVGITNCRIGEAQKGDLILAKYYVD